MFMITHSASVVREPYRFFPSTKGFNPSRLHAATRAFSGSFRKLHRLYPQINLFKVVLKTCWRMLHALITKEELKTRALGICSACQMSVVHEKNLKSQAQKKFLLNLRAKVGNED
eukprot:sb/3476693/